MAKRNQTGNLFYGKKRILDQLVAQVIFFCCYYQNSFKYEFFQNEKPSQIAPRGFFKEVQFVKLPDRNSLECIYSQTFAYTVKVLRD